MCIRDRDISHLLAFTCQPERHDELLTFCLLYTSSFVPVEFGRFKGGVIDAKIKRFNADDSSVKLGYRTTRSDWLTSHIDENNKR